MQNDLEYHCWSQGRLYQFSIVELVLPRKNLNQASAALAFSEGTSPCASSTFCLIS